MHFTANFRFTQLFLIHFKICTASIKQNKRQDILQGWGKPRKTWLVVGTAKSDIVFRLIALLSVRTKHKNDAEKSGRYRTFPVPAFVLALYERSDNLDYSLENNFLFKLGLHDKLSPYK